MNKKKLIAIAFSSLLLFLGYSTQIRADEEVITDVTTADDSQTTIQEGVEESRSDTTVNADAITENVVVEEPVLATQEVINGWQNNHTQYYIDGVAVNGMQKINGDYYLFSDNKLDTSFVGLAQDQNNKKWYFLRNGQSDWTFTGVSKSVENGRWYHANKGQLDWGFTGFSKSVENNRWYFSRKGCLDWNFTGVAKSVENGRWYHGKGGCLDWNFTGLSKSVENNNWYHSKKGSLDWSYTGVSKSVENNRYYYAKNGKLDWSYTGLAKDSNKNFYYVKNGAVMTSGNAKIDKAVSWALTIAMNDYYGYSQARRMSGRDFDCSSFVYYALLNAGYNTKQLGTYAFTTYNIAGILKSIGFKTYNYSQVKNSLKPGDLLLSDGHVEIYIGNGKTVGAHYPDAYDTYGDRNGKEISVENLSEFLLTYTRVIRL